MYIGTRSTDQVLSYPLRGFARFDETFAADRFAAGSVFFRPHEVPGAMLVGVLAGTDISLVVFRESPVQIIRLANIKLALGIL